MDIERPNLYDDMKNIPEWFAEDTIGKFKDETEGKVIAEVCALRPKLYSVSIVNAERKAVAKGVTKAVLTKTMGHDTFVNCLTDSVSIFNGKTIDGLKEKQIRKFYKISQSKHELFTDKLEKVALSAFDSKRYWLDCGYCSYAYGHNRIADALSNNLNPGRYNTCDIGELKNINATNIDAKTKE